MTPSLTAPTIYHPPHKCPTKTNTDLFVLVNKVIYPFRETMAANSWPFLLRSSLPWELQKSFLLLGSLITLSGMSHPWDTTRTMSNSAFTVELSPIHIREWLRWMIKRVTWTLSHAVFTWIGCKGVDVASYSLT